MVGVSLANLDNQPQVLDVLNKVTLELQKRGIQQWHYPWNATQISRGIKNNYAYIVTLEEKIIGTFFIKEIGTLSELTIEPESLYLYQIAILPEYQGKNLGTYIMDFADSLAIQNNKAIYLDCWAGND